MSAVRTTCPYCGVGCGILASAGGGIQGDPDHPANFGRLCSKGSSLGETTGLEGRLLQPRLKGQDISWDAALGMAAAKFREAIDRHGPDSAAFYVSGQLLTEDYYVANKLMKGFIGSANIDTNSRLCMASSVAGHRRAFGSDTVPGQYEDFEQADLVVLVGSNLAWCHPVLFQRLEAAKAARPSMKVVTVDPRRTATSKLADLHLSIRPDGDTALFNALLAEIGRRGLHKNPYAAAHVEGLQAALQTAQDSDPATSGLGSAEIAAFADLWCRTEKVVTLYSQGVNQSACGTGKVNAILNCHLAAGRIGRPGMGPFSMTGQPNAMGGREVGGLSNMLACHLDIENPGHRQAVQDYWRSPVMAQAPGLKAVDLFNACADGRIKALWIMSTNPVVSMPDADTVAAAIRKVPFTISSDILADTDTNRCADLLLPAAGWGEKSGTVTNSERRISRQRRFLPVPGAARPDWAIIAAVGRRMGWTDAFDFKNEAEVFREYAGLSAAAAELGSDFDISGLAGLSDQEYDQLAPVTWPVPASGSAPARFFANGGFMHPSGRARMLPVVPPAPGQPETPGIRLNTGRVRDQWHTMTRTGRAPRLGMHLAEPYLELHPQDAARAKLAAAEIAEVNTSRGRALLRVMISDKVQPGQGFAPMHWTAETASSGRINTLVPPVTDPFSGQPALKGAYASVKRYEARWYGFAVSRQHMRPQHPYAAIARCSAGWLAETAADMLPQDWEAEARNILGLPDGIASLMTGPDPASFRLAIHHDGLLAGAFFASPTPVLAARAAIADMLGTEASASSVLAGLPAAGQPSKGAIVCACNSVGADEIRRAIAGGAGTVGALGACLGAGANCGSCRPELQEMIEAAAAPRLAAE